MKLALITILTASLAGNFYQYQQTKLAASKNILHVDAADEPIVIRTSGGLLEVSKINAIERFQSSQSHSIVGVSTGKTVAQIRIPAVYRYHIELAPEWKIRLKDGAFIVIAPPVKPSLPVAIQTTEIQKESLGIWSALTGNSVLDKLQLSVSPVLASRASSQTYINLQRESARMTVKEFVAKWLITQEKWKLASTYPVRVYFADEPIQALGGVLPDVVAH